MVAEVGFTYQGRTYTADEPCMFDNYCTPTDFARWAFHAGQWVAATGAKAFSQDQRAAYTRIAQRYAKILKINEGCRVNCMAGVEALTELAKLSNELIASWGDEVTEDEVKNDWGWFDAIHLPLPNLPGIDLESILGKGMFKTYLPLLAVLAAIVWFSRDETRQRA